MKLESTFYIPAPPEKVFSMFLEPEVILASLPGLEEFVRVDEETYKGTLRNEVAHVRFNASFTAKLEQVDAPHLVRAKLQGEDRRLASSIKADARLTVTHSGDGSQVDYGLELALWGAIGRLGEAIVRRRTAEVQEEFVRRFTRVCQGLPAVEVPAPASVEQPGLEDAAGPVARSASGATTNTHDGQGAVQWKRWAVVATAVAGLVVLQRLRSSRRGHLHNRPGC